MWVVAAANLAALVAEDRHASARAARARDKGWDKDKDKDKGRDKGWAPSDGPVGGHPLYLEIPRVCAVQARQRQWC